MSKRSRQFALLAVLLVILGWMALRMIGGGSVGRATSDRGSLSVRSSFEESGGGVVEVRLAELEPQPGRLKVGRNPFGYRQVEKPPPKRPRAERKPPPRARPAQQPTQARPPAPRPPAVNFSFLGSFGARDRKIAVYTDNQEIYNVIEGGVVKEEFVVKAIGLESADIGFVNFPNEPAKRLAAGG